MLHLQRKLIFVQNVAILLKNQGKNGIIYVERTRPKREKL